MYVLFFYANGRCVCFLDSLLITYEIKLIEGIPAKNMVTNIEPEINRLST